MNLKYNGLIAGLVVLVGVLLWTPAEQSDLHAEIQQRLLEAEMGSATTFYFAAGSRAMVPDGTATDVLIKDLESAVPETRWQAAKQLAVRRDPRAVEAVIRAMRDPGGTIRVCVMASVLGHLKDPRALSALTEAAFEPDNRDLRLCAIQSLGMIGDRASVSTLIEALKADNMPIAAANALARIGDERGVMPIIQAAHDPQKQLWMIMALGELGSLVAQPYLQSIESGRKASIHRAAQESLWKINQLAAAQPVVALTGALANETIESRRMWAAFRLGELKQAKVIPALIQGLDDESRGVQGRSAAALIRIGASTLPVLWEKLQDGSASSRLYAAAILGYVGGPVDIARLQGVVQESEPSIMADVARHSVDLINSFSMPQDEFNELVVIGKPVRL